MDGRDLASDEPGGEHERGDDPCPDRRRWSVRDEDVQPDQGQRVRDSSVMYGKPVALQCEISRRGSRGALLLGGPNLESSTGSYFYPLPNIW